MKGRKPQNLDLQDTRALHTSVFSPGCGITPQRPCFPVKSLWARLHTQHLQKLPTLPLGLPPEASYITPKAGAHRGVPGQGHQSRTHHHPNAAASTCQALASGLLWGLAPLLSQSPHVHAAQVAFTLTSALAELPSSANTPASYQVPSPRTPVSQLTWTFFIFWMKQLFPFLPCHVFILANFLSPLPFLHGFMQDAGGPLTTRQACNRMNRVRTSRGQGPRVSKYLLCKILTPGGGRAKGISRYLTALPFQLFCKPKMIRK